MQILTSENTHPYKRELKNLWRFGCATFVVLAVSTTIGSIGITESRIPAAVAYGSLILLLVTMLAWAFLDQQEFPRRNKTRDDQLVLSAGRLARDQSREERRRARGA
ncbi:MAG: hypothetical protein O2877_00980 [bacterium]|nr:hypothetical protein [bacterium]